MRKARSFNCCYLCSNVTQYKISFNIKISVHDQVIVFIISHNFVAILKRTIFLLCYPLLGRIRQSLTYSLFCFEILLFSFSHL
jgi:hypothetical protein